MIFQIYHEMQNSTGWWIRQNYQRKSCELAKWIWSWIWPNICITSAYVWWKTLRESKKEVKYFFVCFRLSFFSPDDEQPNAIDGYSKTKVQYFFHTQINSLTEVQKCWFIVSIKMCIITFPFINFVSFFQFMSLASDSMTASFI